MAFYLAIYDFLFYKIPNVVLGAMLCLLVGLAVYEHNVQGLWMPALAFIGMLSAGIVCYAFGWLGAGDVKYMAVAAAWAMYVDGLLIFLSGMSIIGGFLALAYLLFTARIERVRLWGVHIVQNYLTPSDIEHPDSLEKQEVSKPKTGKVIPYGVAISCGCFMIIYFIM